MSKILFFFTSSYPFGSGETFIENEIEYLSKSFDRVIIVSNGINENQTREVPSNVLLHKISYELSCFQKAASLFSVFSILFWNEIFFIKKRYTQKLTLLILSTLIVSLAKKKWLGKKIKKIIAYNSSFGDEIYLYSYWANDMALAIASIKNCKNKICRAHGWDVYFEANEAKYLPLRCYLLSYIDTMCFISNKGKEYYKEIFPELAHKMDVSRLGVFPAKSMPNSENTFFRIVSCSNVISLKRVHLIVEALAQIKEFAIEWIHFGDGVLFKQLEMLCKETLYHKQNIQYQLYGRIPNSEVTAFYEKNYVDIFVNVSTSEGIPVSIMEAMSFGIPCIATNVGGTSEIVNNANGILLSSNIASKELANTIEMLISLPENEKKLKREIAFSTWNEKYNAGKNYRNFLQAIFQLAN